MTALPIQPGSQIPISVSEAIMTGLSIFRLGMRVSFVGGPNQRDESTHGRVLLRASCANFVV